MKYFITVILMFFSTLIFAQTVFLDMNQKVRRKTCRGYSYQDEIGDWHRAERERWDEVSKVITISIRSSQDASVIVCMFHKSGRANVIKDFFVQELHRLKTFKKVYRPRPAIHDKNDTMGYNEGGMNFRGEIMSCFFVYDIKTGELLRSRYTHKKFEEYIKTNFSQEMKEYVTMSVSP